VRESALRGGISPLVKGLHPIGDLWYTSFYISQEAAQREETRLNRQKRFAQPTTTRMKAPPWRI
jgi:hypothetical protein